MPRCDDVVHFLSFSLPPSPSFGAIRNFFIFFSEGGWKALMSGKRRHRKEGSRSDVARKGRHLPHTPTSRHRRESETMMAVVSERGEDS